MSKQLFFYFVQNNNIEWVSRLQCTLRVREVVLCSDEQFLNYYSFNTAIYGATWSGITDEGTKLSKLKL